MMAACTRNADSLILSDYDLKEAIRLLSKRIGKHGQGLRQWLSGESWSPSARSALLDELSRTLLRRDATVLVAQLCSPLLLELLSRCTRDPRHDPQLYVALGRLVARFPSTTRFTEALLEKGCLPAVLLGDSNDDAPPAAKRSRGEAPLDLVRCCWQLLSCLPQDLRRRWDWSSMLPLLQHQSASVRWYAAQSLALLLDLSAPARKSLLNKFLPDGQGPRTELRLATEAALGSLRAPVWPPLTEDTSRMLLSSSDLSPDVTCVSGILLHQSLTPGKPSNEDFFQGWRAPSAERALRSLVECVSWGRPTLLRGPVGSGKTSLVQGLASQLGRTLITVQLGDQADAHTLVGGYVCSEGAGQFTWREGPLTRALKQGCWLLLEDLERATPDVSSLLLPVLQMGGLPGCPGAAGFQLLATHREGGPRGFCSLQTEALWSSVFLEHPSRDEMKEMITHCWPPLEPIAGRLLDMLDELRAKGSPVKRAVSQRDLVKLCRRLVAGGFSLEGTKVAEEAFLDAMDCLCQSVREPQQRLALAQVLGARLGLSKGQSQFYCTNHKPSIQETSTAVIVGRAKLSRRKNDTNALGDTAEKSVFAGTRPALVLLEQLAVAVAHEEPVLLVGETGVGKTAAVQHLAQLMGRPLTVLNMSQQSDSTDLLGGFKPVDVKLLVAPLRDEFERLFGATFSLEHNAKFLGHITTCFARRRWHDLLCLMQHSQRSAVARLSAKGSDEDLLERWQQLGQRMQQAQSQLRQAESGLAFVFVEGALVRALETGAWVLLDEINLAEGEALESLAPVLDGSSPVLFDRGDKDPVRRHPDFRLFACMNPATDVGKKDLPAGIRSRFTEVYLEEPLESADLELVAGAYLGGSSPRVPVELYLALRQAAQESLADGTGRRPHYSLRTLCRALRYAAKDPCNSWPHSLYQGFCLSFLTALDRGSHPAVESLIRHHLLGKQKPRTPLAPPEIPSVQVEGYWVARGPLEPVSPQGYVLTATVRRNLRDLARAAACGRHPVLLQGETSAGKTSLVRWLAAYTGHTCIRVNNHEHTDLEEYLGSYGAEPGTGSLVFREGVLVEAMRKGHWIILDELNLACSEILEALNRVLDDNRELFVPETQEVVRAHPHFLLFATQNPPGRYGGRKVLSRAFRNRFLELHFEELPPEELKVILEQRCSLAPSLSSKMVAVMSELQLRRRETGVFAGRHGYMTLRDLFRWAERYRRTPAPEGLYDWNQHLADEGYALLAGRVRRPQEAELVAEVLAKHFKRDVDPEQLFSGTPCDVLPPEFAHLVWTRDARRLAELLQRALRFEEPVLLVGETGCGKTTLCQLWAALQGQKLRSVSCHLHSEAGDMLGGLRPGRLVGGPLFEWVDGPLVEAMAQGDAFLVDEISLAEDAVLERLNSLLEPERILLLPDSGRQLVAHQKFRLLATMNPGGDFGKRELSPALRNRFTEIWCPGSTSPADLAAIANHNVGPEMMLGSVPLGVVMGGFLDWLCEDELAHRCIVTARDVLAWVELIKRCTQLGTLSVAASYVHGARLAFLDGLGTGTTSMEGTGAISALRVRALAHLQRQLVEQLTSGGVPKDAWEALQEANVTVVQDDRGLHVGPFLLGLGPHGGCSLEEAHYSLGAETPRCNALRLVRAIQLDKPILLEGAPGVGKTSLVAALAKASGHQLTRINLSEQTDIADLFGADLPVEGGTAGQFAWRDGPLLRALREGHWVLLDELNLASQSVLEGLNACLDHRGEVFVPELGRSFKVARGRTHLFGCQNPYRQGGARRGLPRSFLNRFTLLALKPLGQKDLEVLACCLHPSLPEAMLHKMVLFNQKLVSQVQDRGNWGSSGSPWEWNLRDVSRWAQMTEAGPPNPGYHVGVAYAARMRTPEDRNKVLELYEEVFEEPAQQGPPQVRVTNGWVSVGNALLDRRSPKMGQGLWTGDWQSLRLLNVQATSLEALTKCLENKLAALLVGPSGTGKTAMVQILAKLAGRSLAVLPLGAATDALELLGNFEQVDLVKKLGKLTLNVEARIDDLLRKVPLTEPRAQQLMAAHCHIRDNRSSLTGQPANVGKELGDLRQLLVTIPEAAAWTDVFLDLEKLEKEAARPEHVGGCFEWQDSVLVTSLQQGHWLLLENVNLCSASVLDRLNGLLEPGGVLPLTEQGVVGEALRVIRPHPDFRLIMTMDPRHGEISRAMRNRTVEIYIPGEDGGGTLDLWDTHSLLSSVGLVLPEMSGPLLEAHRQYSEASAHTRKPTLATLRQAAALCVQRLESGVSPDDAIRSSFEETHLAAGDTSKVEVDGCATANIPWNSMEAPEKQQLLLSLAASQPLWVVERYWDLACICKDSLALCAVLAAWSPTPRATLPVPLELGAEPHELMGVACRLLLERSTVDDWSLRLLFVGHLGDTFGAGHHLEPLGNRFSQATKEVVSAPGLCHIAKLEPGVSLTLEEFPIDVYQYPDLLTRLWPHHEHLEELRTLAFRLQLLLRQGELEAMLPALVEPRDPKSPRVKAPLEQLLVALRTALSRLPLSSGKSYNQVRLAQERLLWLWEACCEPEVSPRLAAPRAAHIAQHWSWLRKALTNLLAQDSESQHQSQHLVLEDLNREPELYLAQLASAIGSMDKVLLRELPPQHRLRSRIVKRMGQPCALRDEDCAVTFDKVCRLAESVWEMVLGQRPTEPSLPADRIRHWLPVLKTCLVDLMRGSASSGLVVLEALGKELAPSEESQELPVVQTTVQGPVGALRSLLLLVEETSAIGHLLGGNSMTPFQPDKLWHPLHGTAAFMALEHGSLGEVSAWWVEHLCALWNAPCALEASLAHCTGWQECNSSTSWLKGHQVYLSPIVTIACCAMSEGRGFQLGLGDRAAKCAELEALRTLLGSTTDCRLFWTAQVGVLDKWFHQLVSALPGFSGTTESPDWWCFLELPEELRELVHNASLHLKQLASCGIWSPEQLWSLGVTWTLVGLCSLQLLVPWDPVDPVYKATLKLVHVQKELKSLEEEERLRDWVHKAQTGQLRVREAHPALAQEAARQLQLQAQVQHLLSRKAHRAPGCQYEELARQMRHCAATLSSVQKVEALLKGLCISWEQSRPSDPEVWSWLTALETTVSRLRLENPSFRDLCYPFLCGVAQLTQGIRVLAAMATSRSRQRQDSHPELALRQALAFPVAASPLALAALLGSSRLLSLVSSGPQKLMLLRSALQELVNGRLQDRTGSTDWIKGAHTVFSQLLWAWEQNEEEQRQERERAQSLYQIRSHLGEEPQEQAEEKERQALFPSYAEEFEEPEEGASRTEPPSMRATAFDDKEAYKIWQCHTLLTSQGELSAQANWLEPFILRYQALRDTVQELGCSLDPSLDGVLLSSHMVASWSLESRLRTSDAIGSQDPPKRQCDLYHDAILEETVLCEKPLLRLMEHVESLLVQFPGHPGLYRVLQLCKRILGLPVSSPVMRFLHGLEMLLALGQDWESGAHRGISLSSELDELTELVVRWRKLELQSWSQCLDSVQQKRREANARWWFFLQQLLAPLIEGTPCLEDKVRECIGDELVRFLGDCRLGDLEARLDLLRPFLHEALASKSALRGLLFNLCHFYEQYLPGVQARILADRSPIEKKLKEFVRIVRWKDLRFWAIKQAVDKSHRVLQGHIKEFQRVLDQHASCTFEGPPEQQAGGKPSSLSLQLKPRHFLDAPVPPGEGAPRYARRMRQLLVRVILNRSLVEQTLGLDELAGQVAATVKAFEEEDAAQPQGAGLSKEERETLKQRARGVQQRKRKALADLLKALAQLGLSHRKGQLCGPTARGMLEAPALEMKPGVGAGASALESNWRGCHTYYYRSVAGLSALAASCPSKELDPQLMSRCCGFAAHLAALAVEDRCRSSATLENLGLLSGLAASLEQAAQGPLPPQTFLDHWTGKLSSAMSQATSQLQQLLLLLRAWPKGEGQPDCEPAATKLQAHLSPLDECFRQLAPPAVHGEPNKTKPKLLGHPTANILSSVVERLTMLAEEAHVLGRSLCPALEGQLVALAEPLEALGQEWAQTQVPNPSAENKPPCEILTRRLLLAVQEVHKLLGKSEEAPEEEVSLSILRDKLKEALCRMNLERVGRCVRRLVRHLALNGTDAQASQACGSLVPLLRHYLGVGRYLATVQLAAHRSGLKLLHILASLFTTLAKKGLCIPEEWREELEKEGAPELQELEEGGLGEGEGAKDVSDRLESEDQLEGTKNERQEQENERPKDEEQGVEMSEDFDAPAQDPEEQDEGAQDGEDSQDEEELDDQMGDVQGDQKLDQELWDKEEEAFGENGDEEEEEGAQGEQQSEEPQLGARDRGAAPQDEEPPADKEEEEPSGEEASRPPEEEQDDTFEPPGNTQDHHNDDQNLQEPEPLELPEEMELGSDVEENADEEPTPQDKEEPVKEEGHGDEEDQGTQIPGEAVEEPNQEEEPPDEKTSLPLDTQDHQQDGTAPQDESGRDGAGVNSGDTQQGYSAEGDGPQEKQDVRDQGGTDGSSTAAGPSQPDNVDDLQTSLKTSSERSVAELEGHKAQRLPTMDVSGPPKETSQPEVFRHVQDEDAHDDVALDAATPDQAQSGLECSEEEQAPDKLQFESPKEEPQEGPVPRDAARKRQGPVEEYAPESKEASVVETAHVERGPDTSFHTRMDVLVDGDTTETNEAEVEHLPAETESWAAWEEAERTVAPLVLELCEQLRLVLEPTRASRLKGDFRTGKRLSMRRVIAYLASQLRKDKIWLRRVQPSQRQYRVLLAMDDSLSMGASGPLALQSLALLAQSLCLLEAGELAVASFGERVRLLHPLGRPWTREAGASIAGALSFQQKRTRVAPLLRAAETLIPSGPDAARLLLLISDGRGICSEGDVAAAVRDAHSQGLLMVFLVLDSLNGKDSILEVRQPVFGPLGQVHLRSYMEQFPFPFYLLLRDLASMPAVLGEALRQWLELVAQT